MKMFLSDNNSGAHAKVLEEIVKCNIEHERPYGNDIYSEKAKEIIRDIFEVDVDVYFVATGTAANVIGLSGLLRSYEGIIAPESAHINEDECGAMEKFSGNKIIYVEGEKGKLSLEKVQKLISSFRDDEHQVKPKIISITQATEFGTVYEACEIREIAEFAHKNNMLLHVDGARIANAAVALDVTFKEMIVDTGVDLLSFGGTKNGMMFGEAIICFRPELSEHFKFIRKQGMQLVSKMRFISAQFIAYLEDDLWKANAKQANDMAKLLEENLKKFEEVKLEAKVETNMIFAYFPKEWIEPLQEKYPFYVINPGINMVRLVTSFDTKKEEVEEFINMINDLRKRG
ncbi:threonine aldolase family protein [Clostridium sp. DL1XJH146]